MINFKKAVSIVVVFSLVLCSCEPVPVKRDSAPGASAAGGKQDLYYELDSQVGNIKLGEGELVNDHVKQISKHCGETGCGELAMCECLDDKCKVHGTYCVAVTGNTQMGKGPKFLKQTENNKNEVRRGTKLAKEMLESCRSNFNSIPGENSEQQKSKCDVATKDWDGFFDEMIDKKDTKKYFKAAQGNLGTCFENNSGWLYGMFDFWNHSRNVACSKEISDYKNSADKYDSVRSIGSCSYLLGKIYKNADGLIWHLKKKNESETPLEIKNYFDQKNSITKSSFDKWFDFSRSVTKFLSEFFFTGKNKYVPEFMGGGKDDAKKKGMGRAFFPLWSLGTVSGVLSPGGVSLIIAGFAAAVVAGTPVTATTLFVVAGLFGLPALVTLWTTYTKPDATVSELYERVFANVNRVELGVGLSVTAGVTIARLTGFAHGIAASTPAAVAAAAHEPAAAAAAVADVADVAAPPAALLWRVPWEIIKFICKTICYIITHAYSLVTTVATITAGWGLFNRIADANFSLLEAGVGSNDLLMLRPILDWFSSIVEYVLALGNNRGAAGGAAGAR